MLRSRVLAAVAVGVLAVGLLVGCGRVVAGSGTPPPRAADLLARTVATMKALTGFAVKTSLRIGDDTATSEYRSQGDDGTGTVVLNGSTVQVRRADGQVYAQAPAIYWRSQGLAATAAASIDGRWTTLPANSTLGAGFDAAAYSKPLTADDDLAKTPVRAGRVDGVRVWILSAGDRTAAIAADGAPRLVQLSYGSAGAYDLTYPSDQLQVSTPDDLVPFPGR